MAVRTLEGDGTARGSFDGDLSGFGIAGGAPFEGMLVAQGLSLIHIFSDILFFEVSSGWRVSKRTVRLMACPSSL